MSFGVPAPNPVPRPGNPGFDGAPDLLVGEITTIRTFDLQADGTLWGLMHFGRRWVPGPNTATCERHERAGARGCRCGFWSYGHRSGIAAQPSSDTITAVIDNWGRITPGTRGIRSEHAAIRALYLGPHVSERLARRVAGRYPGVSIHRDEDAMLAVHPLTQLGVFDTSPVTSPFGRRRRLLLLSALIGILIVSALGVLFDRDTGGGSPGDPLVVAALFFVGYAVLKTAAVATSGARSEAGTLLNPARAVTQINTALATVLLFVTFLLPGAPATSVALFLLTTVGRQLLRRRFAGTVPVRRTPGGLILRAASSRYRTALAV